MLRTNCTLSPFSLRLMESQLERETCIFSSLRTAIFQNVQSLQYIRKDIMVIRVPYECPTSEIIVFIFIPLPVVFICRQLLKVCADRRKNGRLRKYYSKIQNAGDRVARTGVRDRAGDRVQIQEPPT